MKKLEEERLKKLEEESLRKLEEERLKKLEEERVRVEQEEAAQREEQERLRKLEEERAKKSQLINSIIEFVSTQDFINNLKFINNLNENKQKLDKLVEYNNNKNTFNDFYRLYTELLALVSNDDDLDINSITEKFEELKTKYNQFNAIQNLANIMQKITDEIGKKSIIDLKNDPIFLNLIKPLTVCYSKISDKAEDIQKKKIKSALIELNKNELVKDKVTEVTFIEWMKTATQISTQLTEIENSNQGSGIEAAVYEQMIAQFKEFYDKTPPILSSPAIIRMLFEKICGAALVVMRTRPQNSHNTSLSYEEIIKYILSYSSKNEKETKEIDQLIRTYTESNINDAINTYTVRDYMRQLDRYTSESNKDIKKESAPLLYQDKDILLILRNKLQNLETAPPPAPPPAPLQEIVNVHGGNYQVGGYKYDDILVIEKDKLKYGNFCSSEKTNEEGYGPFAAIYTPEYNNFDIYAYLFGLNKLKYTDDPDVPNDPNYVKEQFKEPVQKFNKDDKFGQLSYAENTPQNLMEKLNEQGNIVLFGYGFSGSGKTYALLEGSKMDNSKPLLPQKYDPSLLEQFMKDNFDKIEKVEFIDIYPLGIGKNNKIKIFYGSDATAEDINVYGREYSMKDTDNMYTSLPKGTNYEAIKNRISKLETYRRQHLRILATPNNDNSSRSFLQITITLTKGNKLIFFDMPGSENTVRIKTEYFGEELFKKVDRQLIGVQVNDTSINPERVALHKSFDKDKISLTEAIQFYKEKDLGEKPFTALAKKVETEIDTSTKKVKSTEKVTNITKYFELPPENQLHRKIFKTLFITVGSQSGTGSSGLNGFAGLDVDLATGTEKVSEIVEKLMLFLNAKSVDSIKDLTDETDIIKIPNIDTIKLIISNFFTNVIFKKKGNGEETEIKNVTEFKYFTMSQYVFPKEINEITASQTSFNQKLSLNNHLSLSDQDKNNIESIYEIPFNNTGFQWRDKAIYDEASNNIKEYNLHPAISKGVNVSEKVKTEHMNHIMENPSTRLLYDLRPLCKISNEKVMTLPDNKFTFQYANENEPNVMIKYFLLIINNVVHLKGGKINDIACKIILFYIYKYINFIVRQGEAIVTNLEHLKFFFLSNTDNIGSYNEKCDDENIPNKKFVCNLIEKCDLILKPKTYTVKTQIADGQFMNERVNMGQMNDFRLLSILQYLAKRETNIQKLPLKLTGNPNPNPKSINEKIIDLANGSTSDEQGATFVMFTNIKIFRGDIDEITDPSNNSKIKGICVAERDTFNFAQDISSSTQTQKKVVKVGGSRYNEYIKHINAATHKFNMADLFKHRKKPKTHRNFSLKKNNKSRNKNLFSSKTKKNI